MSNAEFEKEINEKLEKVGKASYEVCEDLTNVMAKHLGEDCDLSPQEIWVISLIGISCLIEQVAELTHNENGRKTSFVEMLSDLKKIHLDKEKELKESKKNV